MTKYQRRATDKCYLLGFWGQKLPTTRLDQIDQELTLVRGDRVVRIEGDYQARRAGLAERRDAEILATRLAAGVLG